MDKNLKVELNEKWWKDNQPRTLADKGKLGPALKKFENNWKLSLASKGPARLGCLEGALQALKAVDAAAKKNVGACKTGVHDNAKHVLSKSVPKTTADFAKVIQKEIDAINKKFKTMDFKTVEKDRTLFNHFCVFANEAYFGECTQFLIEGKNPNDKVYEKFIPRGAPMSINIKYATRAAISAAYEAKKVKEGPWKDAYKEIYTLTQTNFTSYKSDFVEYLMKQKVTF